MTRRDRPAPSGRGGQPLPLLLPDAGAAAALVACLAEPAAGAWRRDDLRHDVSWDDVVSEASRHRLDAVLHHRLSQADPPAGAPPLDATTRRRLALLAAQGTLRARAAAAGLAEALGALATARVPVIPLKGAYLAHAVYPAPGLRAMSDVDLLVPADAVGRATGVLLALGYGPVPAPGVDYAAHQHEAPLVRYDRLPVELHRRLDTPASPFRVPVAELWAGARPAFVAGVPTLALAPAHLVLHLAVHLGFHHRFAVPLRAVYDVALVARHGMQAPDWPALVGGARRAGAEPLVRAALALAAGLFGAPVPQTALDALRTRADDDAALAAVVERLLAAPAPVPEAYRRAHAAAGAAARLRLLARTVVPTTAEMRRREGGAALGPAALAGRYAAHLAGLVRRQWALIRALGLRPGGVARAGRQLATEARVGRWLEAAAARATAAAPGGPAD